MPIETEGSANSLRSFNTINASSKPDPSNILRQYKKRKISDGNMDTGEGKGGKAVVAGYSYR